MNTKQSAWFDALMQLVEASTSATANIEVDTLFQQHAATARARARHLYRMTFGHTVDRDAEKRISEIFGDPPRRTRIGKTQRYVLGALILHKGWHDKACGWVWDTPSNTKRILESLIKYGLVEKAPKLTKIGTITLYKATDKGRRFAKKHSKWGDHCDAMHKKTHPGEYDGKDNVG